jgi:hypothetical protein
MTPSILLPDTYLPELGEGSGYFLLAFRGLAFNRTECRCLDRFYANVFGPNGETVLSDIGKLVKTLGWAGQRKVRLAPPGCARITHDEVSLLSALQAAQTEQNDLQAAHMRWLLGGHVSHEVMDQVQTVSTQFFRTGLEFNIPAPPERPTDSLIDKMKLGVVGIA